MKPKRAEPTPAIGDWRAAAPFQRISDQVEEARARKRGADEQDAAAAARVRRARSALEAAELSLAMGDISSPDRDAAERELEQAQAALESFRSVTARMDEAIATLEQRKTAIANATKAEYRDKWLAVYRPLAEQLARDLQLAAVTNRELQRLWELFGDNVSPQPPAPWRELALGDPHSRLSQWLREARAGGFDVPSET